jgi:hypothetical protein
VLPGDANEINRFRYILQVINPLKIHNTSFLTMCNWILAHESTSPVMDSTDIYLLKKFDTTAFLFLHVVNSVK